MLFPELEKFIHYWLYVIGYMFDGVVFCFTNKIQNEFLALVE